MNVNAVMAGHSRPQDGLASLAYIPAIHVLHGGSGRKTWMPGLSPGMTECVARHAPSLNPPHPEELSLSERKRNVSRRCSLVSQAEGWWWWWWSADIRIEFPSTLMGTKQMRFKAAEATTIIVAAIALVGSLISAFYTYANSNRELDIKLVEIGISILRADPKDSQTHGAREWAINIIEKFSGQRFSEAAKNELLQNRLRYVVTRTVTQTHISSSSNDILDSDPPNKSGGGSRDALPKD